MDMLRLTMVEASFRPPNEEPRNLLDFVDEQGVERMRDRLKTSIRETRVRLPLGIEDLDLFWAGNADRL